MRINTERLTVAVLVIGLCIIIAGAAMAADADYKPAKVLDVQAVASSVSCATGLFAANCASNTSPQVTLNVDGVKITAQMPPTAIGTGSLYLSSHPEALMVGADVEALAKGGWLTVKVQGGKVLKFKVSRMEKLP